LRKYWFDLLIAALAVASMLELIVGRDSARTTLWFGLPALAILVLPIFARRRFRSAPSSPTGCSRPGSRSSTGS
jgi:hypothetical protein